MCMLLSCKSSYGLIKQLHMLAILVTLLCLALPLWASDGHDIFLTPSEIEAIKRKIATTGWAKKEYQDLLADADKLIDIDLEKEIPPRGGNWNFYYQSPQQHNLILGRQTGEFQWEHVDKVTGKVYTGNSTDTRKDWDGVVIGQIHNLWAKGLVTLGLAYKLTGDKKYARKAIAVLTKYVSLYRTLPYKNRKGETVAAGGRYGKLFLQSLEESLWLVNAISGASLVWNHVKEKDRMLIRDSLFYPICNNLYKETREGISNIDCWQISALGLTGLFFDDKEQIKRSLYDPSSGYGAQISKGINRDGFWRELSIGYHFYALHPLLLLNRAANNCGVVLDNAPLMLMLNAPLKIVDDNFNMAGFNDSNMMNLRSMACYYEWGYSILKNPQYLHVLAPIARGHEPDHPALFTKFALLFGADSVARPTEPRKISSYNYPASGLAALVAGRKNERLWLNIKYDTIATPHRHFDIGHFEIIKGKEYVSRDPGKGNYSSNHHPLWYRASLSHNTYAINGQSQRDHMKSECIGFGKDKDIWYIKIRSEGTFGDSNTVATVTRTIALFDDNTIFVADEFTSTKEATIDISYHQNGVLEKIPGKPMKGLKYTYARLRNPVSDTTVMNGLSTLLPTGEKVNMRYFHNAPTQWIIGEGLTRDEKDPHYIVMRRKTNAKPLYWCVTLDGRDVTFSEEKSGSDTYLVLSFSDGTQKRICIGSTPPGNAYTFLTANE